MKQHTAATTSQNSLSLNLEAINLESLVRYPFFVSFISFVIKYVSGNINTFTSEIQRVIGVREFSLHHFSVTYPSFSSCLKAFPAGSLASFVGIGIRIMLIVLVSWPTWDVSELSCCRMSSSSFLLFSSAWTVVSTFRNNRLSLMIFRSLVC